jgi:hypothetical protein
MSDCSPCIRTRSVCSSSSYFRCFSLRSASASLRSRSMICFKQQTLECLHQEYYTAIHPTYSLRLCSHLETHLGLYSCFLLSGSAFGFLFSASLEFSSMRSLCILNHNDTSISILISRQGDRQCITSTHLFFRFCLHYSLCFKACMNKHQL